MYWFVSNDRIDSKLTVFGSETLYRQCVHLINKEMNLVFLTQLHIPD